VGYFLLHLASPYHPISTFASLPPRSDFPSVGLFFGQKVAVADFTPLGLCEGCVSFTNASQPIEYVA
jgi:hypothetical protein